MSSDEPKIIVDDDWKSQVEKEKQQLQEEFESSPQAGGEELPEASFALLLSTLGTQALAALGQLPDPEGKASPANKPVARHYIDLISVLEAKTAGNLDENEKAMLTNMLHQLRMVFVSTPETGAAGAAEEKPASSTIELP